MKFLLALVALAVVVASTEATYNRCTLAQAMYKMGVPKADLNKWVCIAQHESGFNTAAVGPPNKNGSRDYGIFQINDKYWCQPAASSGQTAYNQCKVSCNSLLSNDISASVRCALKVKSMQGFSAWSTWKYCSGSLPSISDCF